MLTQAQLAAGRDLQPDRHIAWYASEYQRVLTARKRMKSTTNSTTTAVMEFVYLCHFACWVSGYEGLRHGSIRRYRVVKKTKTRLYVDENPCKEDMEVDPSRITTEYDYIQRTFILDRQEYERTGKAERRTSHFWAVFYATPEIYFAEQITDYTPPCLAALGLLQSATVEEVKRSFRLLSKTHHPDRGGDAEAFVQLRGHYEEALLFAKSRMAAAG